MPHWYHEYKLAVNIYLYIFSTTPNYPNGVKYHRLGSSGSCKAWSSKIYEHTLWIDSALKRRPHDHTFVWHFTDTYTYFCLGNGEFVRRHSQNKWKLSTRWLSNSIIIKPDTVNSIQVYADSPCLQTKYPTCLKTQTPDTCTYFCMCLCMMNAVLADTDTDFGRKLACVWSFGRALTSTSCITNCQVYA